MKFGFVNNFAARLVRDLDAHPNSGMIYVDANADELRAVLLYRYVALTLFKRDENGNEAQREVVYATLAGAASEIEGASYISIERGQEGTEIQSFRVGDGVEARLTAGCFSFMSPRGGIAFGNPEIPMQHGAFSFVAIGNNVGQPGNRSVAVGAGAQAPGSEDVALGNMATVVKRVPPTGFPIDGFSVAMGPRAAAGPVVGLAVGVEATGVGYHSGAFGAQAAALGRASLAVGQQAMACSENSIATGRMAIAQEKDSMAEGKYAVSTLKNGKRSTFLPYLALEKFTTPDPALRAHRIPNDITYEHWVIAQAMGVEAIVDYPTPDIIPQEITDEYNLISQTSTPVILGSTPLFLHEQGASARIVLPERAMLFVDSIDVVVGVSESADGAASVSIASGMGSADDFLENAEITRLSVGHRSKFLPLTDDGTPALHISVASACSGFVVAKVVVRGYVMESDVIDQTDIKVGDYVARNSNNTHGRWGKPGENNEYYEWEKNADGEVSTPIPDEYQ